MYNITEESTIDAAKECLKFGQEYYDEVGFGGTSVPYNVDEDVIFKVIDAGLLKIFTVRDDFDRLVGFAALMLIQDFLTQQKVARYFCIYIKKPYRRGRIFYKLVSFIEDKMEEAGATNIIFAIHTGENGNLPERMGYGHTENVFQKFLGE